MEITDTENDDYDCPTTIHSYKTRTITIQGNLKQFEKDFSESRTQAQLQKEAAISVPNHTQKEHTQSNFTVEQSISQWP